MKTKIISKKDLIKIKSLSRPIVVLSMVADLLHHGHINILKKSSKLGTVIVALMTDKGVKKYKGNTFLKYKYRKEIVSQIRYVDHVIPLDGLLYPELVKIIKADYFVHGTDSRSGPQKKIRKKLFDEMKRINGKVVEIPYTKGISSTKLKRKLEKSHKL